MPRSANQQLETVASNHCQNIHPHIHHHQSSSSRQSIIQPPIIPPSYLLQLSAPGSHKHHRVLAVGVGRHRSHAFGPVLVQRVTLDDPQASERLVQHQATEVVSDLFRLRGNIDSRRCD